MDDIKETTVTEEKKEIVEQYKKLLFIVNPKAGQKKREDILVDVINIFNDYGTMSKVLRSTIGSCWFSTTIQSSGFFSPMVPILKRYSFFWEAIAPV